MPADDRGKNVRSSDAENTLHFGANLLAGGSRGTSCLKKLVRRLDCNDRLAQ